MSSDEATSISERRRELVRRRLASAGLLQEPVVGDRAIPTGTQRPLSPGQQRMWSIQQLDPRTVGYNVTLAVDISGEIDPGLLGRALNSVVARHDILRTTYRATDDGAVVQVVGDDLPPSYEQYDLRDLPATDRAVHVDSRARALAARPFDLAVDSPLRVAWISTGAKAGTLVVVAHHIVWDDATTAVFFGELMTAYRRSAGGDEARPERPARQFADVAAVGRPDDAALAFWRARLDPVPPLLDLPGLSGGAGGPGQERTQPMAPGTGRRIREFARSEGVSVYMVLFAAVSALLYNSTGAREFLIGAPVVNRDFAGADEIIGYLGNTVPLRAEVDPAADFRSLLARCRTVCLESYAHQHVELDDIARVAGDKRVRDGGRLFDIVLSLRSSMLEPLRAAGFQAIRRHVAGTDARFALTLAVEIDGDDMSVEANYPAGRAADDLVAALLSQLDRLLGIALSNPVAAVHELGTLDPRELDRVLRDWNDTAVPGEVRLLPDGLAARAMRAPEATAVTGPGDHPLGGDLTYGELSERAARFGRYLAEMGIGPEDIVALAVPRSPLMVVAVLGILAAGAAYVPVDPSYPPERVRIMLDDARPDLVVTVKAAADALPLPERAWLLIADDPETESRWSSLSGSAVTDRDRRTPLHPDHPAYIIYTSGSTGVPKGVVVSHRAVSNHLDWALRRFPGLGGRTLLHSSVSFDFSVTPLYGTLLCGGVLELCDEGPDGLATATGPATFVKVTPSHVPLLPSVTFAAAASRTVVVAGEALHGEALADWQPPADGTTMVINEYGPTETTVGCTLHDLTGPAGDVAPGPVPIGRPVANTRTYVLDRLLRPVAPGVVGELYIGGVQLARGYLRRPGPTALRFVADPFEATGTGSRLYRTGDRVRWNADGALEFVGRTDDQVKVGGFRVEPGEIEAVLTRHPDVARAVVVGRSDGGPRSLVGYVVLGDDPETGSDGDLLREYLSAQLPEYMVPTVIVVLDDFPLSPSGKVDRGALPVPESGPVGHADRAPTGAAEETLARIFAEVLHRDSVAVTDSFLELGGDSILTIQLVGRARKAGLKILPKDVFEHRTIEALAAFATRDTEPEPAAAPDDPAGPVEPSPIMRSFAERGVLGARHRMSVLLDVPPLEQHLLVRAVDIVLQTHHALRSRLVPGDRPHLVAGTNVAIDVETLIRRVGCPEPPGPDVVATERAAATDRLDPEQGVMVQLVWFDRGAAPGQLLLIVHHLVVDGVSLRILVDDLARAWRTATEAGQPALTPDGTSLRAWSRGLAAGAGARAGEIGYWEPVVRETEKPLGSRYPDAALDTWATVDTRTIELDEATTEALTSVAQAYFGTVEDILLTAFGLAVIGRDHDTDSVLVLMEGHGREESAVPGADLSRTVGWFTTQYPVRLDLTGIDRDEAYQGGSAAGAAVKRVKEALRATPDHGIGYGILRHFDTAAASRLRELAFPQVGFNYLGRMDTGTGDWSIAPGGLDAAYDPTMPVPTALVVNAVLEVGPTGQRLTAHWMYARGILTAAEVETLTIRWRDALDALIRHAAGPGSGGHTPSDLSLVSLNQSQLDALEAKWRSQ